MRIAILKNSFHNTEARVKTNLDPRDQQGIWLDIQMDHPSTERRIRKALCGQPDCCCGIVR